MFGILFHFEEGDEWLCDHEGVIFAFDTQADATKIRDLLHPGGDPHAEVLEYTEGKATRPYPWPELEYA